MLHGHHDPTMKAESSRQLPQLCSSQKGLKFDALLHGELAVVSTAGEWMPRQHAVLLLSTGSGTGVEPVKQRIHALDQSMARNFSY
jgi:hypothetical protein